MELKPLEIHNNDVLRETIDQFQPDVVHVFSLFGLSKSLIFTLYSSRRPVVYDVYDHWLSANVREDPWLHFWNAPSLSFLAQSKRKALEMSGERIRLDSTAPTRLMRGYDRVPGIFGEGKERANVAPNSIPGFRFDRMYFCSQTLKHLTEQVGFCVQHAEIIYPGITAAYIGDIKPAGVPMKRFLVVSRLNEESGVMTAIKALKIARNARLDGSVSGYGRGIPVTWQICVPLSCPTSCRWSSLMSQIKIPTWPRFTSGTTFCSTRPNGPSRFHSPPWKRWAVACR